jgi:UPF0755 protein
MQFEEKKPRRFYHSLMRKKRTPLWVLPLKLFGFAVLTCLLFFGAMIFWGIVPTSANDPARPDGYIAKVNPRSGVASIAKQLRSQGIEVNGILFQLGSRALMVHAKLKPGTYLFPLGASTASVLLQMARGESIKESVAFIPGMTIWQLRQIVDTHPAVAHQTKGLSSAAFSKAVGLGHANAEGLFFPDTYIFDPGESDLVIYRRAADAMQKNRAKAWSQTPNTGVLKTPYDLLILASIIEKETGKASERGQISAVFHNRLKIGMRLQTDPTVIYGIGPRFDGNLRKVDLRRDNPYNTYMRAGLPPTPIAIPSMESLLAAANPVKSDALYFVAKGDGSSHFSKTLAEHEKAVDQYQRSLKALSPKPAPQRATR